MKQKQHMDYIDIAKYIGVSVEHTRNRLTKRPDFPRPAIHISQKLIRWNMEEVIK